jgi:hypothetical protein
MDNPTRLTLLLIIAGAAPLVWGWAVHWLISRLWPLTSADVVRTPAVDRNIAGPPPFDYQI